MTYMSMSKLVALGLGLALIAVAGLLGTGSAALAEGKAQTFTEHAHNQTDVFYDYGLCSQADVVSRITITNNGVFHVTELANGTYHVTGTVTGTFLIEPVIATLVEGPDDELVPVPEDPPPDLSKPTYTGRFTQWFGENSNLNNENGTFTFRARGIGSDGSTIQLNAVAHFSVSATGVETSFETENCH